jgi:putative addiction module antidote
MIKLTVRKVGNSLGVILPAEASRSLRVQEGDALYLTEAPEGFKLSAFDPKFADVMAAADECDRLYRNALRELAK